MDNADGSGLTAQFLIAEFTAIQDRAICFEQIKSNRINYLLIAAGATIAGLSTLASVSTFSGSVYYLTAIGIAAFLVLLLGIATLKHNVDYSGAAVSLFRRAGRIRLWFLEHDIKAEPYFVFEYSDDRPRMDVPFLAFRGGDSVILVVNAASVCAILAVVLSPLPLSVLITGAAIGALLSLYAQVAYIHWELRRADEHGEGIVKFPWGEVTKRMKSSPAPTGEGQTNTDNR